MSNDFKLYLREALLAVGLVFITSITLISLLWNTIFGLASRDGNRSYTIDLTERISGLTSFHHSSPHVDPVSIILILFVSFILYSTRPYNSKGN
jgi:hypothetical protein